jgi:hypothetical protein
MKGICMENPSVKITISKHGKNAGIAVVEMMQEFQTCHQRAEELAVLCGPIQSREDKHHFDDDNPVYHDVNIQ